MRHRAALFRTWPAIDFRRRSAARATARLFVGGDGLRRSLQSFAIRRRGGGLNARRVHARYGRALGAVRRGWKVTVFQTDAPSRAAETDLAYALRPSRGDVNR